MYDRMLIPLDGSHESEAALAYVELLAGRRPVEVTLFQAADTGLDVVDPKHELFKYKLEEAATQTAEEYLKYVVGVLRDEGVNAQYKVQLGRPADCILQAIEDTRADLVVMMSRGRSGIDRFRHGSVAWELRHRVMAPMLVVPSGPHAAVVQPWGAKPLLTDVVVPLDGSVVAEQALPHAAEMALRLDAPLHLLRVVTRAQMMAFEPGALGYYYDMENEMVQDAEAYLTEQAGKLPPGVRSTVQVVRGLPAPTILDMVERLGDALVCMTTHGRSGLGRVVLGSVAEKVTQESGMPVLLVRAS